MMDIQDSISFGNNSKVTSNSNWKSTWKKIQQCGFDFQSLAGLILSEGSNLGQHDIADIFEKSLILLLLVENSTRQLNSNQSMFDNLIDMLSNSDNNRNKSELLNVFANHAQKANLVSLLSNLSELSSSIDITQLFNQQQQQPQPLNKPTIIIPSCNSTHRFVQPSALIPTSVLTSLFNIPQQQQQQAPQQVISNSIIELKPSSNSACSSATTTPILSGQVVANDSPFSSPNPLSLSGEVENDDEFESNENPLSSSTDVVPQSSSPHLTASPSSSAANNSNNNASATTKRKRRPRAPAPFLDSLFCHSCGETQTSQWRRGPDGCKSLCNACGIRFANIVNKEKALAAKESNKTISINMLLNDSAAAQSDNMKNDSNTFPVVPSAPTTPTSVPKAIPFYSNTKLAYAPAPPKKSNSASNLIGAPVSPSSPQQSSYQNNNSNINNKRKLSNSTNTTLPIISSMKSHKTFHSLEGHDLTASIHQSFNNLTSSSPSSSPTNVPPTKFSFANFPLDALSTIASSEALLINNDQIIH